MATIALVTGGNRGIGLEVVKQLTELGMITILGSRDAVRGEAAAIQLSEQLDGQTIPVIQLDIDDLASVAEAARWVADTYGKLDVLINNAGVNYDTHQHALSVDLDNVLSTFKTNTLGAWRVTQAFVSLLKQSGHGRIVNVSSGAGELASMTGGTPAYSLSKLALNGLTLMLASALQQDGILVNAVCPGWIATDMGGPGGGPIEPGGKSVVWAATLEDNGSTGGFFRHGERIPW
ncbi:MAG: SDR family NAD(P)-dependent oxidoreductase [Deinococcota bacterium]